MEYSNRASFAFLVRRASFVDSIVVLGEDGRIIEQGSFDYLTSRPGYVLSISSEQPTWNQKANPKAKSNGEVSSVVETARLLDAALPKGVNQGDMRRRDGDTSVYRFYLQSAGLLSPIIIIATMITLAFCDGFPSESHSYLIIAIFTNK